MCSRKIGDRHPSHPRVGNGRGTQNAEAEQSLCDGRDLRWRQDVGGVFVGGETKFECLVTRGRQLCFVDGTIAEDSGPRIGAASVLGEQDEVELDDREKEARKEPTSRVAKIPRGPSARSWLRFSRGTKDSAVRTGLQLCGPKGRSRRSVYAYFCAEETGLTSVCFALIVPEKGDEHPW